MNVHLDVNPNAWFGDDAYDQRNGRAPDVPLEASKCSRVHGAALRTTVTRYAAAGCLIAFDWMRSTIITQYTLQEIRSEQTITLIQGPRTVRPGQQGSDKPERHPQASPHTSDRDSSH